MYQSIKIKLVCEPTGLAGYNVTKRLMLNSASDFLYIATRTKTNIYKQIKKLFEYTYR